MLRLLTAMVAFGVVGALALPVQAQGFGSRFANGGLSIGQTTNSGGMQTFLGINAVQGGQRFIGSSSVVGTSIQGQPFYVFDGVSRPFVTGVVPVVSQPAFSPRLLAEERAADLRSRLARARMLIRSTGNSQSTMKPARSAREIFAERDLSSSDWFSTGQVPSTRERASYAYSRLMNR